MIKAILFDLDGVLIDAKEVHYQSLNRALGSTYAINRDEHIRYYDGKKTIEKLNMLSSLKGLPKEDHSDIWMKKQKFTKDALIQIRENPKIVELFEYLTSRDIRIGVCSNSIRETLFVSLSASKLMQYVSLIVSNEDVTQSKPHPEMYWKAMSALGVLPEETIIVEDSPPGLLAAQRSGARYIRVKDISETCIDRIEPHLNDNTRQMNIWKQENLNVLIPMAGAGSRFVEAGYTFPKPLIEIHGKPMIQTVVENLGLEATYHYVVQKEHRVKYNLDSVLNIITPNCKIIETDGVTEGAACTALLAKEHINNDNPLFFANSDQYCEWNPSGFMYHMQEKNADGGILTFDSTHPKWSYAKVNELNEVTEVAEKNPISNKATVGYYYWKHGSDFIRYSEDMIQKDIRVNNEFYVCPVFNQAIGDGKKILTYTADRMWGLGTPEDLAHFLNTTESV